MGLKHECQREKGVVKKENRTVTNTENVCKALWTCASEKRETDGRTFVIKLLMDFGLFFLPDCSLS